MIVLADRNFAAAALIAPIAASRADVLVRVKTGRRSRAARLRRYRDSSYLSQLRRHPGPRHRGPSSPSPPAAGQRTGLYRLVTTLLDHRRHPASRLIKLYHQRWEIETAYLELKSTILGGRVLRARTPAGIDQEIYALLVTYQLLRTAMADATAAVPGTDPDRASFTIALHTARDQLIQRRRHHRQHHHRPDRHHRPPRTGQPAARPAAAGQPPHRQTRHLQIPGPRP